MLYRVLADAVLLIHGLFVAFVVFGGLLTLLRKWWAWVHLPALTWGAGIIVLGGVCPLTPLENELRIAAGQEGYPGGFIEHYIVSVIYPAGLLRWHQVVMGIALVAGNAWVYACWYRKWFRPAVPRAAAS